jgi:outer membrane protein
MNPPKLFPRNQLARQFQCLPLRRVPLHLLPLRPVPLHCLRRRSQPYTALLRTLLALLALVCAGAAASQGAEPPTSAGGGPVPDTWITFDEALALAAVGPSSQVAAAQLEIARQDLMVALSPVRASVGAAADGELDLSGDGGNLSARLSANAVFNVVPYGPSADAIVRARNRVERAQAELRTARDEAALQAAELFAAALRARQEVEVLASAVELADMEVGAAEARRQAGAASDAAVLRAQIELTAAGNDLAAAHRNATDKLADLSTSLGVWVTGVADEIPVASAEQALQLLEIDPATAVSRRNDLRAAEFDVAEAQLELAAAHRGAGPALDFGLSYSGSSGETSVQLGAGFDTGNFQPSLSTTVSLGPGSPSTSSGRLAVGVALSIPLDRGSEANVVTSEIGLEQAQTRLEQSSRAALIEIDGLRGGTGAAAAQAELADSLELQASSALEQARAQYDSGLISIIDLRQAELSLLQARIQAARARDSYLFATMHLALALALDPLEVLQ